MALTRLKPTGVDASATFTFANANVNTNANLGNLASANYFSGNGSLLTSVTGSNVTGYVPLANAANTATSATSAGTVTTSAQPNITSVGTLSSLSITGLTTATGGIKVSNIQDSTGTNAISVSYSTVGIVGNLTVGTGGTGNVSANYFIGNGSLLTGIVAGNITGQVANSLIAGTVYTNAQPNITSVGTLSSLSVTANASAGNILTNNLLYANGVAWTFGSTYSNSNVSAYLPTYTGLVGGTLTTAAQPNVTSVGTLSSLTVSGDATITGNLTVSGSYTYANVTSFNVKDPIIEQGGNPNGTPLSSNDGKDRGQILHYYSSSAIDAFMGWDNSNSEFGFGSNVSVSSEVVTWNSYGNIRAGYFIGNGSTLTNITGANITGYVPLANAANTATTAGTVTTAAQPNITSVGTLTSLTASGLITATSGGIKVGNLQDPSGTNTIQILNSNISVTGNIVAGSSGSGNVTATYFIGNGSQLTGISGTYSNTNVAAYLPTYTGNFTAGNANITTTISLGSGSGGSITGANLISANYFTGTLTTAAQPNITSLGTLSSLTVTANTTSGNIRTDNLLYANGVAWTFGSTYSNSNVASYLPTYTGFVGGALSTAAQPSITSVGSLTGLTVAGTLVVQQAQEAIPATKTGATGLVSHDFTTGGTFYHTSVSANFTCALTNFSSTAGRATVIALVIAQGATAYYANNMSISTTGTANATTQTIKWVGGSAPVPTSSAVDVQVFTIINIGGTYTVLGQLNSYT